LGPQPFSLLRYRYSDNIIGIPIGDMDWNNPLRSIAPTVDADVLQVLAGTHASLTGRQVSRLAGRSYAQVHAVLARLVTEGLATVEQHGHANSFRLNRDHLLAGGILEILTSSSRAADVIRAEVSSWASPPVSVCLFGSAARGHAEPRSDVDLLVVRSDGIDQEDPRWRDAVAALAHRVEILTGNPAQVVELNEEELRTATATGQPLVGSLRAEARTVFGVDVRELTD
jgi:predicted nucleotidyltransferase